jgi:pyruvate,water dikinase
MKFLISKLFLFERRIRRDLIPLINEYNVFENEDLDSKTPNEILESLYDLFELNKKVAYFNIIIPLLNLFFNNRLMRKLEKHGLTIDSINYQLNFKQDLTDFDPNYLLEKLNVDFQNFSDDIKTKIQKSSYEEFLEIKGISEFQNDVLSFIDRFGHLSESGNDFSTITWEEKPKETLDMIVNYSKPVNNIEDTKVLLSKEIRSKGLLNKIEKYRFYKEQISFEYTYGYTLFRKYISALSKHYIQEGIIEDENDLYYLTLEEITEVIKENLWEESKKKKIKQIKQDIEKYRNIVVPATIYGDEQPPITFDTKIYHKFMGKPTSPGYYIGRITKVRGMDEFNKIKKGDVLVIPYSDVSWTPIISKAGAVISESGGMLSHCSIISREYKIPAIVSVDGIFQLNDGDTVSVNGFKGEVSLIERVSEDN